MAPFLRDLSHVHHAAQIAGYVRMGRIGVCAVAFGGRWPVSSVGLAISAKQLNKCLVKASHFHSVSS